MSQPRPETLPLNKPVTAGAIDAVDEDRWFDALCDDIEAYLHLYVAHREAPKSERDALALEMHEAKLAIVDRFYAGGWKS